MSWSAYLRFRPAFAQVIDPRMYSMEWLDARVADDAQFMCTDRAAIVTEIRTYPTGAKDIHGLIAAGDVGDIVGVLIPAAERMARDLGCLGAIIESRPGWARVLKSHGYAPYQVALRKDFG